MIILIDNYDSFTYNLYQYISELGYEVEVYRNDKITIDLVKEKRPTHIVISPGPGVPEKAGISIPLIQELKGQIPIFGVCLGHQAIGSAFGAKIVQAPELMHGKTSEIFHTGEGLFTGLSNPFIATRYHSLIIDKETLPDELEVTAWTEDNLIMAVKHKEYKIEGVQFHPESILTEVGKTILKNFIEGPKMEKKNIIDYKNLMTKLSSKQNLSEKEMYDTIYAIMSGDLDDIQIAGFLSSLATKGETVEEITGAAKAMFEKVAPIDTHSFAVDTCGTGADKSGTFNISTAAAFVAAGAGVTVAKHGNRSITSLSGSADVLEELGINITADMKVMEKAINEIGIGFLFAPVYHTSMKYVMPARKALKMRTIFNILGPIVSPARAQGRVMGVFDANLLDPIAQVLVNVGVQKGFVVHGNDGLDEISLTDKTTINMIDNGKITKQIIDPVELGFKMVSIEELKGNNSQENAKIILYILNGEKGPKRDIVVLNAAAAIIAGGKANTFGKAIKLAEDSIDSGKAFEKLEKLKKISSSSVDDIEMMM